MATPEKLYAELMKSIEHLDALENDVEFYKDPLNIAIVLQAQRDTNKKIASCLGHLLFAYRRGE